MAPRKTKAQKEAAAAPASPELTPQEAAKQHLLAELRALTPADLVKKQQELKKWVEGENKKLSEFLAPHVVTMKTTVDVLLEKALKDGVQNYATEFGTAYISKGFSHKVDPDKGAPYTNPETGEISTGREALLDWLLANWDQYGAEHAMINIGVEGVKAYMAATKSEQHPEGLLPPGISIERWQHMQVRKA